MVQSVGDDPILKDALPIEWLETLLREIQRRILIPQRNERSTARRERSTSRRAVTMRSIPISYRNTTAFKGERIVRAARAVGLVRAALDEERT